jgi:hypothetical protein
MASARIVVEGINKECSVSARKGETANSKKKKKKKTARAKGKSSPGIPLEFYNLQEIPQFAFECLFSGPATVWWRKILLKAAKECS